MPQTPNIQSPVSFRPVTLTPVDSTSVEVVERPTCIPFPEIDEPMTEEKLLGVFRRVVIATGLDCTAIARVQTDPSYGKRAIFSRILAIFVIVLLFFRFGMLYKESGKVMSFPWAESNMFAFLGIHSIVCGFCLFGWTKNSFFPIYLKMLNEVKRLRIKPNKALDDYTKLHKKAYIWGTLWILAVTSHSIASAFAGKVTLGGRPALIALYVVFPFITFLATVIVTLCVIFYFFVNCSLSREIEYFNNELETAVKEKQLGEACVLLDFCHRQAELIRLVRKANESLGSYASYAPLFLFNGLINAVYIAGFEDVLPTEAFVILLFNLFAILAMCFFTLRPTSNVQFYLVDTSRILMDCEEFEKSKDSDLFQNYHIIIDRSLKTNTRIRVAGGIPIYQTTMNVSMVLLPNLGNILGLVRKVMIAQGLQV